MAKKTSTKAAGAAKKSGKAKPKAAAKPKAKTKAAAKPKAKPKPKAAKTPAKTSAKSTAKSSAKSSARKSPAVAKAAKPKAPKPAAKAKSAPAKSQRTPSPSTSKPRPEKTPPLKISKPPATAIAHHPVEPPEPPTQAQLRKADSGLTRQEKDAYRKQLVEKRAEILGDVESLKTAALSTGGNLSNMPLHMADVGSDQFEQESMLGLVESERRLLREINEALVRLQEGTYGVCVESGKPIGKARLDVTPWAKYTIEVVREKERLGQV